MGDGFANHSGILNDPLSDLRNIMEVALHVDRRSRRNSNLKQIGIHADTLAGARSDRGKSIEHRPSSLITFTSLVVAEHASAANLAIIGVSVNRHMQIGTEGVRSLAAISHRIILSDHNLNTASHKGLTAGFGDLTTLNSLSSISVGIVVLRLIGRRQIYFLGHI